MRVFPASEYDYVTPEDSNKLSQCDAVDTEDVIVSNTEGNDKDCLIAYLEAENERLRAEKAEYWETLKRERERADTMLAALPDLTKDKKRKNWLQFWKK